jgi:anti-sigma factor RsiW
LTSVGGFDASGFNPSAQTETLKRDAISAHRLLASSAPSDAFMTAGDAQLRRWLLRRLGAPFGIPDLSDFGLHFMGGRIMPYYKDNAIAVLLYGDDKGARVTVYLRAGDLKETKLRGERLDDTVIFYWLDSHCGYVIASMAAEDRMPGIAKAVYDHFEPPQGGKPSP